MHGAATWDERPHSRGGSSQHPDAGAGSTIQPPPGSVPAPGVSPYFTFRAQSAHTLWVNVASVRAAMNSSTLYQKP